MTDSYKLGAPFPGMDIPWTQEKKDELAAALNKYESLPDTQMIKLGEVGIDAITSVSGVCTTIFYCLEGNHRIELQPPARRDWSVPEKHTANSWAIDVIGIGVSNRAPISDHSEFQLGDFVRVRSSPRKGKVVMKTVRLGGSVQITIEVLKSTTKDLVSTYTYVPTELEKVSA